MKLVTIVVLSLIAAISAAPTQISENNVGNIITVGLSANVDVSSQVDVTVVSFLAALLNQQMILAGLQGAGSEPIDQGSISETANEIPMSPGNNDVPLPPQLPRLTPEMIAKAKQYLEKMKH